MEIIMKMKNKFNIGLVTLLSVMVLTACGGNNEAEKESSKVSVIFTSVYKWISMLFRAVISIGIK